MTPCPHCDQASVTDDEGCCIHCGHSRVGEVAVAIDFMRDHFVVIPVSVPPSVDRQLCIVCETRVWPGSSEGSGNLGEKTAQGWIHDFCAEHPSACKGPGGFGCTNVRHDHGGQVQECENGGMPVPDSDQLHCADCGLPTHYDSGDEMYHHDDPLAPACFLVAFTPAVITAKTGD